MTFYRKFGTMYISKQFDYNFNGYTEVMIRCYPHYFGLAPEYNNVVSDAFFYLKSNIKITINKRMIIK